MLPPNLENNRSATSAFVGKSWVSPNVECVAEALLALVVGLVNDQQGHFPSVRQTQHLLVDI